MLGSLPGAPLRLPLGSVILTPWKMGEPPGGAPGLQRHDRSCKPGALTGRVGVRGNGFDEGGYPGAKTG